MGLGLQDKFVSDRNVANEISIAFVKDLHERNRKQVSSSIDVLIRKINNNFQLEYKIRKSTSNINLNSMKIYPVQIQIFILVGSVDYFHRNVYKNAQIKNSALCMAENLNFAKL